jgi:pimeloyl-ACP methyl ester carboxylesterase
MRPEFMAWRAGIDPEAEPEDDSALAARFLAELPESDAALLRAYDDEFLGNLVWEALVKPEGYLRDAALLSREWDFDPGDVQAPTTVWVGDQDETALVASSWWAERIPGATVEVAPAVTHLATLVTQWPQILRRLSTGLGTATG